MFKNRKNKGYTLIELLAVIVILAIIALIAVPIVLNVIDDARKNAAIDSTYGYIKGIEHKTTMSQLTGKEYKDKEDYIYNEIPTNIKGMKPTGGMYSLKNGVVTSGTFCVDGYVVNYENSIAEATKKGCTEEDIKISRTLKISSNAGAYVYPNSGTFEVDDEGKGGELSCQTSDPEIATCSITGTTVTVTPGTKKGNATITVISAATEKYQEARAAHEAITEEGLISYTASGYEGTYDGEAHGITITNSDKSLEIKYGEESGIYNLTENPTYINAGTYTVYYQISKEGYTTVTGSKEVIINKTDGKITLEATSGTVEYDGTSSIEITENKSNGKIVLEVGNQEIVEASIENNKLKIIGKQIGTTTIKVISEATTNYESTSIEYIVEVTKAANILTLENASGNYTYPNSGEVEVIENTSGGTLTCTTSDKSIADCKIEGNKIKIIPGTKVGQATITVTSAETANYKGGIYAYLVNTAKGTLNSYTVTGYNGTYDGSEHGITVESSGATIKYGTSSGTYDKDTSPKYSDVGTYTVYYKIEKEGYNEVTGSEKVVITKAAGKVTSPTAKTLTYTGEAQELINKGSSSTGTIEYKIEGGTYSESIPKATNAGTYKVYYRVVGDKNHEDVTEASISVTISKATLNYTASGYSGIYDGEEHGITVTASGATIKYGTTSGTYNLTTSPKYSDVGEYTVYYQITREGYNTVSGSKTVIITKADNTLTLSANTGNYTYPSSGTFEITENKSGGALSCTTSNESVATCSISGTTVTVTPGKEEGDATLTIKSEATKNYNAGQIAYVAVTVKGTLNSYTANGYNGVYDGLAHGITVTSSGATIKYGTSSGTYDKDSSPEYTDVGTYTVYYKIEKEGYNTVESSKQVIITKAEGSVTAPTAKTLTYNGSAQTLINAGNSTTGTIEYKLGSSGTYSTNLPSSTNAGTYTVYYRVVGDKNHNDVTERSISVTINKATGSVTAPTGKTLTWTGSAQTLINAGSTTTGTIQYKLGSTGTYSTSLPSATNPGTYTVYYKVVGNTNYKDVTEASISVTISKAANTLTLSANTGTYTYPTSGTFTVTKNTSGGTLSCTSGNTAVATCSISGTTVTVKPGTTAGNATLTIKSAATTNYKEATVSHVATTEAGTLSITANGYDGEYDGQPHGITVTSSGATIKYGTASGTYNLTSSPTYTNVGTYTVYYQVSKAGYKTVTGSKQVVIKIPSILDKAKSLVYTNNSCKTDGTTYQYMGGCYIKGASTNNYVWYNGFMWRIMGINSDNTVRLIVDENVTAIPYGASNTAESYATNEDYIHDWLNDYFLSRLNSTKNIIKEGNYFCNETIGATLADESVRTACTSGKEVKAKVGLISYDEYYLAGAKYSYLNIGQYFWTMTPTTTSHALNVNNDGLANINVVTNANGVRPVINVDATSTITEGDGTTSSYYVLAEDKTSDKTGTISNAVTSGEYVRLEGKIYRVVSKDNDGVKLIYDGYYGTNVAYGDNNTFTTTSGIGAKLNGNVLTWLGLNNSTKIKETNWYQGPTISSGYTYKKPLTEKKGTGINAKVGLIRVGEMLSGQSSTILTNNYTKTSSYSNAKTYWTMNQYTYTSDAWRVSDSGVAYNSDVTYTSGVRPVIKVDTNTTISKGNGTWNNPYEI